MRTWCVYNILVYDTSFCMQWDICACVCQCQRPQSMFCIQLNSNVVFWAVFSFIHFGYVTIYLFSGIKYERERDGKRISCSAHSEKFQTFPIKIISKESSNSFLLREKRKFFFLFRYHKKLFSFSCSCSCSYFSCRKISISYHRTKSRHIREKEKE